MEAVTTPGTMAVESEQAELEVADAVATFIMGEVAKLPADSALRSFGLQDARCWARVAGRRRLLLVGLPAEPHHENGGRIDA